MQAEIQDGWNWRYKKAVTDACAELEEMQAPTPTWPDHAAVIITKHLTPLFRELRDEAKRAALRPNAPHELPPTQGREPRSGTEGAIGG